MASEKEACASLKLMEFWVEVFYRSPRILWVKSTGNVQEFSQNTTGVGQKK